MARRNGLNVGLRDFALIPYLSELDASGSDVRATAAQGTTDSEEAKRLIASIPRYIQDAYMILEKEKQCLGEYPVSLLYHHPAVGALHMSRLCFDLGIADNV